MTQKTPSTLSIQQASAQLGLSLHTLRYYERIGLLGPIPRAENGHRRYSEADMKRLLFIQKMRATGMPIDQLQVYIVLYEQGNQSISQRLGMLLDHRAKVQQQLEDLEGLLAFIDQKISTYQAMEITNG